jgi:hypothetical protein
MSERTISIPEADAEPLAEFLECALAVFSVLDGFEFEDPGGDEEGRRRFEVATDRDLARVAAAGRLLASLRGEGS